MLIIAMESYRCAASSQHARTKFERMGATLSAAAAKKLHMRLCMYVRARAYIHAKWNKRSTITRDIITWQS